MDSLSLELTPEVLFDNLCSLFLDYQQQYQQRHKLQQKQNESDASNKITQKKILIAFSGGLDSHVLLHLLSQKPASDFTIRAVYIDHGLQAESADWAKHCEKTCNDLGVTFSSIDLSLDIPKGESIEEVARKSRYDALYSNVQENEALVTAHHQNDQAETFLLQLFRGAGVQGLAAMPSLSELEIDNAIYLHLRPLLDFSRSDLEQYAKEYNLDYVEDPSNQDSAFDRNYLRNEIMPLLRKRWVGIDKTISRSASIQAETKQLLDEWAEQQITSVLSNHSIKSNAGNSRLLAPLSIQKLLEFSASKQRLLLRYWITKQGFLSPSEKKLQHIFTDLIGAATDKNPVISWQGAELRRYQHCLYLMLPLSEHDITQVITWDAQKNITIESLNQTLTPALIDNNDKNITIRFRQGGETMEIPKRGNISLKNLFQELQIPPWIRSRLPLIYSGEKIIKIVGLHDFESTPPHF